MKITNLNLNYFKVFLAVYESLSMTDAALELHLTQSGVSQHIKALELEIKMPLFTRLGRRLIPTPAAAAIYPDIKNAFVSVSERLQKLSGKQVEPEGIVRIGMPIEFGNNVIVPKLSRIGQKYRKLTFEITLDYASTVSRQLTAAELDFAYVDESPLDRRIHYEAVASENLLLCASKAYAAKHPRVSYTQSYFEGLDYIEYTGTEPILRRWMLHHLKRRNLQLNVRAHIMDVQGVAKFIASGLGVGVLPDHVVERQSKEGVELHVYEGRAKALRNEIRLVRLKGHPLSHAADFTLKELQTQLS